MFRFKQFTIIQEKSAMKVTTDGCLFGAWVAQSLQRDGEKGRMLDIGGGTGLISLMVAQKNPDLEMDAIEIDPGACAEMRSNFLNSPWPDRLNAIEGDVLAQSFSHLYDVVISNPPFYEREWSSPLPGRQQAHHGSGLQLQPLLKQFGRLLTPEGVFFLLLPYKRAPEIRGLIEENHLGLTEMLLVKHSSAHPFSRIMVKGRLGAAVETRFDELCIRDDRGNYSQDFLSLLNDYYL